MRNYLDVETTGFNYWTNSVISLAWIITDDDNQILDSFYQECAPDKGKKVWSVEAESIHGFKESEMRLKQEPFEMCRHLLSFLHKNGISDGVIRYHANANFDTRMLFAMFFKAMEHNYYEIYKYLKPNEHVNTIPLVKSKLNLPSYKLNEVASSLNIQLNHHNALSDTECLVKICKELRV